MRPEDLGIGRLFERVRDAVVVADAKTGRVILWNPAAEEVFGYEASEALGMRVEALVPEHLKGLHLAGISRYAETGRGPLLDSRALLELPAVRKGGEEIFVELSLNPIDAEGGEAEADGGHYVLAILRDVTERKEDEEARARLAAIVESSNDAIIGKTMSGTITSWNRGAERVYGYAAEEIVGRPISVLAPPERAEEIPRILERVGRGEKVEHHETVRVRKDGSRIHASVTVSPVRDASGGIVGASAIARDTTERKRAEDEVRRLNEELEERVAERTRRLSESEGRLKDLVGKLITAQEEERRRVAYEVHDGIAQVAIAAHQHLQAFADDHAAGSSAGESKLDRALSLAQRVVREARHVIEDLRPTALDDFGLASALRLKAEELTAEGWWVAYDDDVVDEADEGGLTGGKGRLAPEVETALYRVAQEALTNARKHAGVEGACMKLVRRPDTIRLEVRDEGCGFDPEAPRRNGGRGERVGMASMRERVALVGGELKITSVPGSGTSVVAEVPLEEERDTKGSRVGGR